MTPDEYEQMLHDAEVKLSRLKALYEQYFQGIEKLEPSVPRKDLDRSLELLRKQQPRNTALRFRLQMLVARYGTYQTYWQRVARQIEEGTYRRDVVRAQQRRLKDGAKGKDNGGAWELDVEVELEAPPDESDVDAILGSIAPAKSERPAPAAPVRRALSPFAMPSQVPAARSIPAPVIAPSPAAPKVAATFAKPIATFAKPQGAPLPKAPAAAAPAVAAPAPPAPAPPAPRPQAPAPAPAPAARPDQLDSTSMRRIYDDYVAAKKKNNERVDNVKYEALEQSVKQMIPKLREKHGDRRIDFEVVVQNGKVGLKPKVG
jgi:hypothetical protein